MNKDNASLKELQWGTALPSAGDTEGAYISTRFFVKLTLYSSLVMGSLRKLDVASLQNDAILESAYLFDSWLRLFF
jgi:hypothetical protein